MSLDRAEDWLGRKRPAILGKEGASAAHDRGQKTLADILNMDDNESFGGDEEGESVSKGGWVDGIGEGRSDEDNLSAYFRMSEGAEEDSQWRTEGLVDLTKFEHRAVFSVQTDTVSLEPTTSSVDEGEAGKVKLLYDLVFEEAADLYSPSGFAIKAHRGGSLDVGVLHTEEHEMRRRCTLEFWYFLPFSKVVPTETILVRRTMGPAGDDLTHICTAANKESVLWELAVLNTGELKFTTCGGTIMLSASRIEEDSSKGGDIDEDDSERVENKTSNLASFQTEDGSGGWNHVCLIFSSREQSNISKCSVTMLMKGNKVASSVAAMAPVWLKDYSHNSLEEFLKKSYLAFALNHAEKYRMTELRVWSCEREEEDIKLMMFEYLKAAEMRKKFRVTIKTKGGKNGAGAKGAGGGSFLTPPASGGTFAKRGSMLLKAPPGSFGAASANAAAAPKSWETSEDSFMSPPKSASSAFATPSGGNTFSFEPFDSEPSPEGDATQRTGDNTVGTWTSVDGKDGLAKGSTDDEVESGDGTPTDVRVDRELWNAAEPLSKLVRSSAAAALIRGPPATRHFGGNRGGLGSLPAGDRREFER